MVSGASRRDEIAVADEWKRRLLADSEMQKRLRGGDRDLLAKLQLHAPTSDGPEPTGTGLDVHQKPHPRSGPSLWVPGAAARQAASIVILRRSISRRSGPS
jgi:hypothetical protein